MQGAWTAGLPSQSAGLRAEGTQHGSHTCVGLEAKLRSIFSGPVSSVSCLGSCPIARSQSGDPHCDLAPPGFSCLFPLHCHHHQYPLDLLPWLPSITAAPVHACPPAGQVPRHSVACTLPLLCLFRGFLGSMKDH